jgi:hypothetical protein
MLVDPSNFGAGARVAGAIRQVSQATSASFNHLLATAQVESGLDPQAAQRERSGPVTFAKVHSKRFVKAAFLASVAENKLDSAREE